MRIAVFMLLAVLATAFVPAARAADYFIVVNDRNPVQEISPKDALHLFMGRTRHFPGGGAAVVYDMAGTTPREGFYRALSGMSLSQVTSYWARLMFSGRNLPPQQLDNTVAMLDRISSDPRAIGWLTEAPRQKGLRVVLVLEGAP